MLDCNNLKVNLQLIFSRLREAFSQNLNEYGLIRAFSLNFPDEWVFTIHVGLQNEMHMTEDKS